MFEARGSVKNGAKNLRQADKRLSENQQIDVFVGFYGAPTRTRTADLLITNQLLYQLSYRGTRGRHLRVHARLRNPENGRRHLICWRVPKG